MPRPLRALFLNEGSQGPGVLGQAHAGRLLEERLRELELEAEFRSLPPMGPLARAATQGVPGLRGLDLDGQAVRWHLTQALRARRMLGTRVSDQAADAIHLHGHTLGLLSEGLMRRIPTLMVVDATIWQWHAMGIWRKIGRHSRALLKPSLLLERRAFATAARVIAMTDWARRGVEGVCPQARVVVRHPGVDLDRFRPAPRCERRLPRALFVGGRFAEKGGWQLIESLGHRLGREIELDVVTPEPVPGREGLRVHRVSPSDPRLVDLFQQADVFCLPTQGDAAPFAVLEAMACATPVVSYDVGAIGELLGDPPAGVALRPGDSSSLPRELMRVAGDPDLRDRLGTAGRRRCEQHYDGVRQSRWLVELISEVAAERAA